MTGIPQGEVALVRLLPPSKPGHAFALASACLRLAFKNGSEGKPEAKQSPWVGMQGPRRAPGMKGERFSPLCLPTEPGEPPGEP